MVDVPWGVDNYHRVKDHRQGSTNLQGPVFSFYGVLSFKGETHFGTCLVYKNVKVFVELDFFLSIAKSSETCGSRTTLFCYLCTRYIVSNDFQAHEINIIL